jgi:hypothetical protein
MTKILTITCLNAVSAPETLKRKMKDGWGVTHEKGTKDVKGYYWL